MKPKRLGRGSLLAVVSPASAARAELVQAGVERLQTLGYRVRVMPHALHRGPLYFAGTLADRLADLHQAFADPDVDGILCTRGGWGSAELLPFLDQDLIRSHPKAFLGYSDHTSLHLWLRQVCGLVTFQAPMVAADFANADGAEMGSWRAALEEVTPWQLGVEHGLRLLRAGRGVVTAAEGELRGGCLALVAESLGTPYAIEPRGGLLFLEDIAVKPYQWDRMLLHCRYAGVFEGVRAIVFGDMRQACAAEEQTLLEQALLHGLDFFPGPIAIGLRSGHLSAGNVTLPFGIAVRLDVSDEANPRMHFLEAAVSA